MLRVTCFLLVAALGGCANLNSIHHDFRPDNGDAMTVDAKQRAIYTVTKDFNDDKNWKAVCAEPSPDALSAISASAAVDATVLNKALGLAFGTQEGAASIGLRTQTITILRDAMYRLCEGYASGALDEIAFARLQRRYQNIMLGLLSIEQLTGAVAANQVSIGGSLSSKLGQSLSQISASIQESRASVAQASAGATTAAEAKTKADTEEAAAKSAYEKALKDAKDDATAQPVKDAKATYDEKAKAALNADAAKKKAAADEKVKKDELASLESIRKDLDRASVTASIAVSQSAVATHSVALDSSGVQKVADSVTAIVRDLVERDYTKETCLDTLMSRTPRALAKNNNPDALELALRFCAYALQAETVRDVAKIPDAGARTLALKGMADTNDAFQKAVTDTLDRARVRYQKKNEPDASVPTSKPSTAPPGTPAPSEKK